MAVSFQELTGSPKITINSRGEFSATRRVVIDWADWDDFAVELYGGYRVVGSSQIWNGPATFPGVPQAVPVNIDIEPADLEGELAPTSQTFTSVSDSVNTYTKALVTINYAIPFATQNNDRSDLPSVPDGTYLTYSADLGAEFLNIPGRFFQWPSGDLLADDVGINVLIPSDKFTLTWHRVVSPPWDAIRNCRGRVNSNTFLNYAAETVLFFGCQPSRSFQLQDKQLWTLVYTFEARAVPLTASASSYGGWNYLFNKTQSGSENWQKPVSTSGGETLYQSTSFDSLFAFA